MYSFPRCNLCGWPLVRLNGSVFGTRCVRCLSTQIHRAVGWVVDGLSLAASPRVYELSSKGALLAYLRRRWSDRRGFSEVYRVLKPGGCKVFSVPLSMWENTRERAVPCPGGVKHLLEPEYHSDRIRGRWTVLAYRVARKSLEDA